MKNRKDLREFQKRMISFVQKKKKCALFLDLGLGKTVTTLTSLSDMFDNVSIANTLVIAPIKVCKLVWLQESRNWEHLKHLRIKICLGNPKQRLEALNSEADIHLINPESVVWLIASMKWKWDSLVIDESSTFRSSKTKRFKALKKKIHLLDSVILLTGTPSPNTLINLWSQFYIVDKGARLGRTKTIFHRNYFYNVSNTEIRIWKPFKTSEKRITDKIKDISVSMKSKDYLELPEIIYIDKYCEFDKKLKDRYEEFKAGHVLELKNNKQIKADFILPLIGKLRQFSNGNIYDEEKNIYNIHNLKLEMLEEIVDNYPSENLITVYNYKSDLESIKKRFDNSVVFDGNEKTFNDWNKGKIKMLLMNSMGSSHGLNLQHGGSMIIWYGIDYNLENYIQMNGRVYRQGQEKPTKIIHILCKDTIDEDILRALKSKNITQNTLLSKLKKELM